MGRTGNPKCCPYGQLISHSIKDCFVLKGKIRDLFNSGSIYLLDDSVKVLVHPLSIIEEMLEANEPWAFDDEETPNSGRNEQYVKAKALKSVESARTLLSE